MVDLEYWPKRFVLFLNVVLCGLDYIHVSYRSQNKTASLRSLSLCSNSRRVGSISSKPSGGALVLEVRIFGIVALEGVEKKWLD